VASVPVLPLWGRLSRHSLVAAAAVATAIAGSRVWAQQLPRFGERVDVARIIVDARVLDDRGNSVPGLTAGDFKVNIDGKTARVETATWIGARDADRDAAPLESTPLESTPLSGAGVPIGPGRLVVFLFQKDLEPSRIVGLMRMLLRSGIFLETLAPSDRVAILSFDSHLKIWTDFTNDRERLHGVLAHGLLFERPPAVQAASAPSLVERLDPDRGRRTYDIERVLELIGEALEPLPGSKSLVLIGHGFGRFSRDGVTMENGYGPARQALVASRTAVFSLDVTHADYHSLEHGLQLISDQTGGFYARTHDFPDLAMQRLAGAIAGYYVLYVEKPESQRATHDIEVELTRRKGHVLASSTYWLGDRRR
jgi:VWFA-related protein